MSSQLSSGRSIYSFGSNILVHVRNPEDTVVVVFVASLSCEHSFQNNEIVVLYYNTNPIWTKVTHALSFVLGFFSHHVHSTHLSSLKPITDELDIFRFDSISEAT